MHVGTSGDTPLLRKARGAFFTPPELCDYVSRWAVRTPTDRVLEPSCGEAAFLLSAGAVLGELGALDVRVDGVELHHDTARTARTVAKAAGFTAGVIVSDFFDVAPEPRYDAVIGNPPYVRYQDFSGSARLKAKAVALRAGVPITGLASSWAPFTVHAAGFCKPGGRMGLVLPAELLSVNYAADVRHYLMRHFGRVRLVLFTERVFPGVMEEVVLLLAEDALKPGGTDHCELYQVRNLDDLTESHGLAHIFRPPDAQAKWTTALMGATALETYIEALDSPSFTTLNHWGETTLGMVTGNNRYFTISPDRARGLGLTTAELLPVSPPGSRHLRGLSFTAGAWLEMGKNGSATYLFRPPSKPTRAAQCYIDDGEANDYDQAYKCRVRKPWWRVPLVAPAHLLLTYMNADTPRLCTNAARVRHLNSVHGVYLRHGTVQLGQELLPLASLNTLTLLGAETVGRSYGGGMLKIEPKEADILPVPHPDLVRAVRAKLLLLRPQMAQALRQGNVTAAAKFVDDVLLVGEMGLRRSQVREIEEAHARLTARRLARGKPAQSER